MIFVLPASKHTQSKGRKGVFNVGSYQYRCIDHSLLDPYLRAYYAKPLHKLIPTWVPANCLSLLGHACVWCVFLLVITTTKPACIWLCLFLLQLYLVMDVLDGMQARVTQTSSPLGEYIDHGGDAYNCGLIIYSSLLLLKVTSDWFYYVLIGLGTLIFSLVSLEKKVTGYCVFPRIGNVELQLFLIVFFALLQVPSIGNLLSTQWLGFSMATWVLFSITFVGGIMSFHSSLTRIPSLPLPFLVFIAQCSLLVTTLIWQSSSRTLSSFILMCFMATYNSEILFSHLTKSKLPWPDWISSLVIILLFAVSSLQSHVSIDLFYAFFVYLIIRALWAGRNVLRYYGQFWVWVNPTQDTIG